LVFTDQVVHVAFRLGELHLIQTLASVPKHNVNVLQTLVLPVEERFTSEHGSKLIAYAFEKLLNSSGVA
jgi:hypothetical protein